MTSDLRVPADDGVLLHARCHGERTDRVAVVCLPGLTRNSRDFTELAEACGADRLVVAVDLRGRGESGYDPTGSSYQPPVYARDVAAILDAAGVDCAAFVGTSLGGSVSMHVAAMFPERVAGIVLNDVGPELQPEGLARIASYAGKLPPSATWADAVAQVKALNSSSMTGVDEAEWERFARQQFREFAPGDIRPDHDPGIVAGMDELDPHAVPDTWWLFDAIAPTPMLVIRGADSDLFSAGTLAEMQRRRPDLQAVTIAGRGHCPTLDEPGSRAAIHAFLAGLDG
jgi:pimeloyl-ACP methyl ester carboxylesterase